MMQLVERRTCSALIVTCSDFRFKSAERSFAQTAGLDDDYDLIARPGGIRSLVQPRTVAARDTLAEEIRLLWSVHLFRRVILLNHMSCRAYDDIALPATEAAVHTDHLLRAVPIVEGMCSGLTAEPFLLEFSGGEFSQRRVDQ